MRRYSMHHIPYMSFYSGDLYWDVCHRWNGVGLLYLFVLLAICWVPRCIQLQGRLVQFNKERVPPIVAQMPAITISKGEAFVDVNQPYTIVDPVTEEDFAIIDTTGQVTSLTEQEAKVLLTKKEVAFRRPDRSTMSFPFDPEFNGTLKQDDVTRQLRIAQSVSAVLIYPVTLIGSWIVRVVQLLIYTAIGLLFAAQLKTPRTYDSLLRIAAAAMTPAIIVKTILEVAGIQIPMPGLCYLLATLCCLFFGIKSAAIGEEIDGEDDGRSAAMTHIE